MSQLRNLVVSLSTNTANYNRGLDEARRTTSSSMTDMAKSAAKYSVSVGASLASATAAMVASSAEMVREQSNMASLAGMNINAFNALGFAAQQYGVSAEQIADISKDASEKIGEYINAGSGGLQDFADAMNMSSKETLAWAESMKGASGQDIFASMITQMEEAGLSTEQMSNALESMGSDVTALIPLFSNNGAELERLTDKYTEFNAQLSPEEVAQYRKAAEDIDLMTNSFRMMATTALEPVVEWLYEIADAWSEVKERAHSFAIRDEVSRLTEELNDLTDKIKGGTTWGFYSQEQLDADKQRAKEITDQIIELNDQSVEAFEKPKVSKHLSDGKIPEPISTPSKTAYQQKTANSITKQAQTTQDALNKEAETLANSLIEQQESIDETYARQSKLLQENLTDHALYIQAKSALDEKYAADKNKEADKLAQAEKKKAESLANQLIKQEETIDAKYARELQLLENNIDDYDKFLQAKAALDEQYTKEQAAALSTQLGSYEGFFGNVADLLGTFAGEQNAIYKTMFAVSKAFAIADSIVQINNAIAKASNATFPTNIGQMAAVASATGGLVSTISSTTMGQFHGGGTIPSEGTYLLDGGETVYTRNQHEQLMKSINGSASNTKQNVNVYVDMTGTTGDKELDKKLKNTATAAYQMVFKDFRTNGSISKQARK